MAQETLQYQIEVQEGTGNGEIVIIYNCDNGEITPELLANTLTELSKQAGTQQGILTNQPIVNALPETYVVGEEAETAIDDSQQFALSMVDLPQVKVEGLCVPSESNNGLPFQNQILIQNPFEMKNEVMIEGLDPDAIPGQIMDGMNTGTDLTFVIDQNNDLNKTPHIIVQEDIKQEDVAEFVNISKETLDVDKSLENDTSCKDHDEDMKIKSEDSDTHKPNVYACQLCDFSFTIQIDLQRHLKVVHNVEDPFECPVCQKTFKVELSLQIHSLMHGGSVDSRFSDIDLGYKSKKTFVCPLCNFEYKAKQKIVNHINKEHKSKMDTIYRCSKCPFTCLLLEELESHEKSPDHDTDVKTLCPQCGISCKNIRKHIKIAHTNSRPYLCTDCGFRAKTLANLNAHTLIHSDVKTVNCSLCSYKCHTKNQLDRHMIRHSSVKKFQCPFPDCSFACKTKGSLKRHTQIHTSNVEYRCSICDFTSRDRTDLKKHKMTAHPRNVSYQCKECNMSFERVAELKKHSLVVHKSNKMSFCAYCDFSCETPQELRDHMQQHYGKYSYVCFCGYTCRLKSLYNRHIARHNKEKKFKCSECSYACVEKADLQKHMISKHSGDMPFACPHCNYKCKFQSRLNNHIEYVHSDAKPYFCKLCSYSGKSAENLKRHLALHNPGLVKTIQCVLCDYTTSEKAKLKRHMQVHVKKAVYQ